jgi:hypothetical protein
MKYLSKLFSIAIILLVFFNVALLLIIKKERKEYHNLYNSNEIKKDSIKQFKDFNNIFLLNFSLMCEFQSDLLDRNIVLTDENENYIKFNQLTKEKPKLIFKYSALNCNDCVDEQIVLLKKAAKKIGSENIVIITDYGTPRELTQFIRMNQISFKIYNLRNLKLTTIDNNLPYYFILDESYSLKLLFFPLKGDTLITQQYFNKINEKYFN